MKRVDLGDRWPEPFYRSETRKTLFCSSEVEKVFGVNKDSIIVEVTQSEHENSKEFEVTQNQINIDGRAIDIEGGSLWEIPLTGFMSIS